MNLFNIKKTFEMKAAKKWPEVYFCIDLHGTIIPSGKSPNDKTDHLEFYPYAQEVLRWMSNRKDIMMILWTATPYDRLLIVQQWLEDNGIRFDYVNSNPHAKSTPRSDFQRKFYFSVGLDDRFGFCPYEGDWILVANELESATGDSIIKWTPESKKYFSEVIKRNVKRFMSLLS